MDFCCTKTAHHIFLKNSQKQGAKNNMLYSKLVTVKIRPILVMFFFCIFVAVLAVFCIFAAVYSVSKYLKGPKKHKAWFSISHIDKRKKSANPHDYWVCGLLIYGRGRRTWTLGTRFWRPLLYQLSYAPIYICAASRNRNPGLLTQTVVGLQGLEPGTNRLWAGCSTTEL